MKIGLDIMGGDFAPKATVLGAIAAYKALSGGQKLVLIGDKEIAVSILQENNFSPDHFEFVHTTEVIGMGEHPTKAVVQKPDSSISVGFNLLKEGEIRCLFVRRKYRRYAGWFHVQRKNHSGRFAPCYDNHCTQTERRFGYFSWM